MIRKRCVGRPGQSLVEVLVAMVVLLIGVFGIIQIFPTGFGIINYSEHVSQAQSLARAALESARANAQNLPDSVVAVAPSGVLDGTLTGATEAHDFTGPVPADPRFFGFNRTRRVFGETTKIPPPTANVLYMPEVKNPATGAVSRELVSIYTLKYGPLYSDRILAPGIAPGLGGLGVYSGQSLERVTFTDDPQSADIQQLSVLRYGINYQKNLLYFSPRPYARRYKLLFTYVLPVTGGLFRAQSLPDTFLDLPAGADHIALALPNGAALVAGEEQVFRAFNPIPLAASFSGQDPFEFKLLNSFVGIIGLNPLGAVYQQGASRRGITAKIDYDVDDWHILSEDVTIPLQGPYRVKLALSNLKQAGTIQENQQPYTALMTDYPAQVNPWPLPARPTPTPGIDVVVADVDTGVTMDSRTLQAQPGPGTSSVNGAIDYLRGVIDFNPAVQWTLPPAGTAGPAESIAGKHVRIYYRAEDDLAVQVGKAFTSYLRAALPLTVQPGQYGQLSDGFLVFPASDHNQSVLIDYSFSTTDGRRLKVSGELQPIQDPVVNQTGSPQLMLPGLFSGITTVDQRNLFWFIRLNNSPRINAQDPIGRTEIVPGTVVIDAVRGVSVRARVAWREGNRWRHLENDTYLMRQGT